MGQRRGRIGGVDYHALTMAERVLVFLCALLAAGCAEARPAARPTSDAAMAPIDSVEVTLEAPARVNAGAPVAFHLTLANRTDHPLTLYLLGREITFDVTVAASDGSTVWQRLDEGMVQGILAVRTLAPRERIGLHAEWGGTKRPGSYSVTGSVLTDGEPLVSRPAKVEVVR
jgi:Intracellular proteinase inhibitor